MAARNSLKTNYEILAGTLLEGFQTIGDWTRGGASGSIAEDTDHYTYGTKSLAITFASGTSVFYDKTINQVVDGGSASMMLKVYIPSLTNLTSIAVYISSVTNFAKYFSKTILGSTLHEGYNYIPISGWTNGGTGDESWANTMVRLRIRINATEGTPSCSFCSLHTRQYNKPKILITFDDSTESSYTKGYAYMNTLGLKGTSYAIGSKLGTANYCTLANLQTMYAAGWDIGNHGSVNLTTLETQALQEAEISGEEAYISEFTRSKKHYAYPMGRYDDNAKAALATLGYLTARTIKDRPQANYLDEKYLLTRHGVYNTTTLAAAKAFVDLALAQGTAVLLNFHQIVDADATEDTQVLTADFNALMDYILARKNEKTLDVVTISEWYDGLEGSRTISSGRTAV